MEHILPIYNVADTVSFKRPGIAGITTGIILKIDTLAGSETLWYTVKITDSASVVNLINSEIIACVKNGLQTDIDTLASL